MQVDMISWSQIRMGRHAIRIDSDHKQRSVTNWPLLMRERRQKRTTGRKNYSPTDRIPESELHLLNEKRTSSQSDTFYMRIYNWSTEKRGNKCKVFQIHLLLIRFVDSHVDYESKSMGELTIDRRLVLFVQKGKKGSKKERKGRQCVTVTAAERKFCYHH